MKSTLTSSFSVRFRHFFRHALRAIAPELLYDAFAGDRARSFFRSRGGAGGGRIMSTGARAATVSPRGGAAKLKSAQGFCWRRRRTADASALSSSIWKDAVWREMRASPPRDA